MGVQRRGRGKTGAVQWRGRLCLPLLAISLLLLVAAPAQATFHLIKVREVYAGANDDSYVELQMFAAGQNFLGGHSMKLYNAAGTLVHTSTFSSTVPNAANQQTVLIGDTKVQQSFGVAPDLIDEGLSVPAGGGAACWNAGGIPADCVAWGNFSGGATLQTATGASAGAPVSPGGIAAGKAIRRTIEPGCPTLLEESDDSDDSATDFTAVTPAPRNDSSPISEHTCAGAPNTAIDDRPAARSNSSSAEFTYEAPTATGYECRLDGAAFSPCAVGGPIEYTDLAEGSHTFQVRGLNASGPDPTPAGYTWIVDTTPPVATIDTHPNDPGPGASVQFTYHAPNESGSAFKCSLDGAPPTSCPAAGITYHGLTDGSHDFAVAATDAAGNAQLTPTEFTWTVDNSLADTTPPQTTLLSKPPDPSAGTSASFTYEANEPGASFECSLDGAAFTSCPAGGVAYSGLANGSHSFQVRAKDPSDNVDLSPAGYSFTVVLGGGAIESPVLSPGTSGSSPVSSSRGAKPPSTVLSGKPAARTHDRAPTFRFRSGAAGVSFQCKLDGAPYKPCKSPLTTKPLSFGRHVIAVRAVLAGAVDPTSAKFTFRVVRA